MEDILSDVLSLCSVETLAYIWVTDDKILGIHFGVLRYILRKNTNCSITELFDSLNRRDICTDRVSDSYRLLHYKKYFLLEKFIKECTRNGLYSFVMKWCEDNEINLCDYDFFGKMEYITEITNYSVSVAFEYSLRHDFSIDSFPLDLVNPRDLIAVAIRYNNWDIIPEDLVYRDNVLTIALLLKNYDLYVDPEKYIPEKYRHLFTIIRPLTEQKKLEDLKYIAYDNPSFLENFELTKDEIRSLFKVFSDRMYDCNSRICRKIVRYLLNHDLWDEFPYDEYVKESHILLFKLHNREDIEDVFDSNYLLLDNYNQWIIYVLIEWYGFDKQKFKKIVSSMKRKYRCIYNEYIRLTFTV